MKRSVVAISFLALMGCGSELSHASTGLFSKASKELTSLGNAEIKSVENFITPGAGPIGSLGGMPMTKVTLEYRLDCWRHFQSFAMHTETLEDQLVIYTQALASQHKDRDPFTCLAFSNLEKVIFVQGYYTQDQIKLIELSSHANVDMGDDIYKVAPAEKVAVRSTEDLCPENMICVTNGTVVNLDVHVDSCVDVLGPVAYQTTLSEEGELEIAIAAATQHSKRRLVARCAAKPWTRNFSISLPNVYVDAEDIKIIEVKNKSFN